MRAIGCNWMEVACDCGWSCKYCCYRFAGGLSLAIKFENFMLEIIIQRQVKESF